MYASSKKQATRPLSRHAQVRSQQRGISLELVDLLLDYGQERHVGRGATVLSFSKSARERLRQTLGVRHDFKVFLGIGTEEFMPLDEGGRLFRRHVLHRFDLVADDEGEADEKGEPEEPKS